MSREPMQWKTLHTELQKQIMEDVKACVETVFDRLKEEAAEEIWEECDAQRANCMRQLQQTIEEGAHCSAHLSIWDLPEEPTAGPQIFIIVPEELWAANEQDVTAYEDTINSYFTFYLYPLLETYLQDCWQEDGGEHVPSLIVWLRDYATRLEQRYHQEQEA